MPTPDTHSTRHHPRRRRSRVVRWATVGTVALVALSTLLSLDAGAASRRPTVEEATVGSLGTVLVTSTGFTLYRFTQDPKNTATCTGTCAVEWPPLFLANGVKRAVGGPGVKGLGTTKWTNGKLQVTFRGEPLYRFSLDTAPGQAMGENVGGTWFVVTPPSSPVSTTAKKGAAPSGGYGS
jgi:predicted lipoprotein with Yx(FWY)xxD motif